MHLAFSDVTASSPLHNQKPVHGGYSRATSPQPLSRLAGVVLPLLQQSVMFFNLGLSRFVLKKDLKWEQIAGAMLVVAGVIAAAWPSDSGSSVFAQVRPLHCPRSILHKAGMSVSACLLV